MLSELEPKHQDLARWRHEAFDLARQALSGQRHHDLAVMEWLEEVTRALSRPPKTQGSGRAQAYFSPGESCREALVSFIASARAKLDICVFTITDNQLSKALVAAHRKGVRLRVISDNDKSYDRGSDVDTLDHHGINVRVDHTEHHMHHKFAIADSRQLVTGSYNWTRSAARSNEENIVIVDDPRLVTPFQQEFDALWAKFER